MFTVLVIDRNKPRLAAAAHLLTRYGYCALSARDATEALGLLARLPVQAVLAQVVPTDPHHAGLVETIRRDFPLVAVAALREPYVPALLIHAVGRCLTDDRAAA
jgi:CheY-like chemotaxis protein